MIILLFIVHVLIALALIGVVMLQKSEGGALGMGGGGMSGFMTGRSTANLLTRTTAFLGAAFFATSILLVLLSNADPRAALDHRPGRPGADDAADAESARPLRARRARRAERAAAPAPAIPAPARQPSAPVRRGDPRRADPTAKS